MESVPFSLAKLSSLEMSKPQMKKVMIPGYGCLIPTLNIFSIRTKYPVAIASPKSGEDFMTIERHFQRTLEVHSKRTKRGINERAPKLYSKSNQ